MTACSASRAPGPHAVVLPVPQYYQQDSSSCGLAAVDMLTAYWRQPLPLQQLQAIDTEVEQGGVSAGGLQRSLQEAGYVCYLLHGRDVDLQRQFAKGRPVLVQIREHPHHWVLVIGHDASRDEVILADPRRGRLAMDRQAFLHDWQVAKHLMIVATPAG